MRVVFLDFDGVVHPVSAIVDWRTLNVHGADIHNLIERRDLFRWLPLLKSRLEAHPDILLAVHSGWRAVLDNSKMKEVLGPDLSDRFIGVTSMEKTRYQGIIDMVDRADISQYLIIDDATHEFPQGLENLVATDPEVGVNDPAVLGRLEQWLYATSPALAEAEGSGCIASRSGPKH
jgi:HAD domain in Swiss Army Knife RNA repair proteins